MSEQLKYDLKFIGLFQVLGLIVSLFTHFVFFLIGKPFPLCIYPLALGLLLIVTGFAIVGYWIINSTPIKP